MVKKFTVLKKPSARYHIFLITQEQQAKDIKANINMSHFMF
jgi:hypothetical protein